MPTATQIRNAVDTKLATLWTNIQARETVYKTNNGKYWQGLLTHTTIPADAVETAPDRYASHPTDQAASWQNIGATLPATLPMAIRIDVYISPQGDGYVATVWVRDTVRAVTYTRAAQVGPETWRAFAWRSV